MSKNDDESSGRRDAAVTPVTIRATASVPALTLSIRSYFSTSHLWTASYAAHMAELKEKRGLPEGAFRIDPQHRSHVTTAVLSSVAFLEAVINEVFTDAVDGQGGKRLEGIREPKLALMRTLWNATEGQNRYLGILEKYALLLTALEKQPPPKDRSPHQDTEFLIRLRNDLVHFKPVTQGRDELTRLGHALKPRFPPNKLMQGMGNPYFPDHCLGAGCAAWAVKTAKEYADVALAEAGIRAHYAKFLSEFPPTDFDH